ncbi:MAG: tyrosine-type recombinase/integrase [Agathobacter sp.]|nr:tyrosine-type recombinase/integrase [Agathobacter sp.]
MTLNTAFENFILSKRLQGCSKKTLKCYAQVMHPLVVFLGTDIDISALTRSRYNEYIAILVSKNNSRSTLASYIRQIKVFFRWLESEYGLDLETDKLKVPRAYKKMVHIYTNQEIETIFNTISAESEWITVRNQAMVALMLDSGLRRQEVASLQSADISWQRCTLKVNGKGNKERVVPFGRLSKHYMMKYRQLCPYSEDYFFIGRRGEKMTGDSVNHFMYKLSSKLPFSFSSHRLRHNFATNYCLNQYEKYGQVDLYRLMILMGHEDIETTRLYLHHANQIIASITAISHLDKVLKLDE